MLKKKEYEDCWRHVGDFKKYRYKLSSIHIEGISGFIPFDISIKSAINAICGRNGIGKSTLLKVIYNIFTNGDIFNSVDNYKYYGRIRESSDGSENFELLRKMDFSKCYIEVINSEDQSVIKFPNEEGNLFDIEYIDSSSQVIAITNILCADANPKDLIEGLDPSSIITSYLDTINKITGKKYSEINLYEISWIDEVIPFIFLKKNDIQYDSRTMGLGEHKLLYLVWKILSSPKNSILLIDEPESFICPRSQNDLMDFIASIADKNKLTIIFSTHSEHIIKKLPMRSWHILRNSTKDFNLVKDNRKELVMDLLGVMPEKDTIFLVEDFFASQVLLSIINIFFPTLINSIHVEFLNGESDIIEIIKRYPEKNSNVKLVAVFDADQKGKVKESQFDRPIFYLPSNHSSPPETEVIAHTILKFQDIYGCLAIPEDRLDHIKEVINEEIHDFFSTLSSLLEIDRSTCITLAIRHWVSENTENIKIFINSLINFNNRLNARIVGIDDKFYAEYEFGIIEVLDYLGEDPIVDGNIYSTKIKYSDGNIVSFILNR